jgi:SsrA-binding protein
MAEKLITSNRHAHHDYHILEKYEAGIALAGTEVKTLRMTGGMTLKDSYADVEKGEIMLVGAHIEPYDKGNIYNHKPERPRRLLMHKHEILKIGQRVAEKGLTLVPLRVYFKHGIVKVEIGLCRGKHTYDKRVSIKDRESQREMDRAVKAER